MSPRLLYLLTRLHAARAHRPFLVTDGERAVCDALAAGISQPAIRRAWRMHH